MFRDNVGVAYSLGFAFPAIAVARSNNLTIFDEAIYSTTNPLTQARAAASVERTQPRPGARSDHPQRRFCDQENRYPRNPPASLNRLVTGAPVKSTGRLVRLTM